MAIAAIVINQQGRTRGSPGCSRDDLLLGVTVVLTNHDNTTIESWTWELLSPAGSKASLRGIMNPIATFVPDLTGSYEIRLTTGGPDGKIFDRRIAAVGTSFLGLRKPVEDSTDPINNRWSAVNEAFDLIDADAMYNLKMDGSNSPKTDISWGGNKITNLGGLELDGVLRFGTVGDPEAVVGKGFLYLRDIGKSTDLFYCGADGALVRLTKDGRLNVPAAFDDRIMLNANDGAPDYLGVKLDAVKGLIKEIVNGVMRFMPVFGSKAETVCAGDDLRLSDARPSLPHGKEHLFGGVDEIGTTEPAACVIPQADEFGRLDSWVSEATTTSKGTLRLGSDLAGSSKDPKVVGLRGVSLPEGARDSFLKWSPDGLHFEAVPYGTGVGTICGGDDARLSNSRQPMGQAGGHLTGFFPNPQVVGITDVDNNSLKIGKIPDGTVLVRRSGEIVGVDPSGRRTIAMTTNERTSSKEGELVGCFILDGGENNIPLTFLAISNVVRSGLVGIVRLHNATDNTMMAELKINETSLAGKRVCGIRLPIGKKLYEVYISLDNGQHADDALVCMWAGLLTDQYM